MVKNMQHAKRYPKRINKKDLLFCIILISFPIAQFAIFYIGVNINTVIMSFQKISVDGTRSFTFQNFGNAIKFFGSGLFKTYFSNSLWFYLLTTVISIPLSLVFSFYIFKKMPFWSSFRVMLFLPQLFSAVVMGAFYRYFVNYGVPEILKTLTGNAFISPFVDSTSKGAFWAVLIFSLWVGFGTNVLMYSNSMSGIAEETIEAGHIDGAVGIKEFWYIVLPQTFSTLSVFIVTGFAGICSSQYHIFDLYSSKCDNSGVETLGYYLFVEVNSKFGAGATAEDLAQVPFYATVSLIITLVVAPLTIILRKLLEKYGPSEN